jgi:hypothetical protein
MRTLVLDHVNLHDNSPTGARRLKTDPEKDHYGDDSGFSSNRGNDLNEIG